MTLTILATDYLVHSIAKILKAVLILSDWLDCSYSSFSSSRAEGKVRHCRILVENGNYMIGSATFDSLTELVQYYESNPLYRRMKLKYAINEEVLKSIGDVSGCGLGVA